jgi:hypothetical protein
VIFETKSERIERIRKLLEDGTLKRAELLERMLGEPPACAVDKPERCCAAYPSGARCIRRAAYRGMCMKCVRRRAPIWVKRGRKGASHVAR